jgi:uncharacterized membrane protein
MENRFKVVYTGELQPYVSAQEAIRNVAALFKVSEDKIRPLVLGGHARNIKVNLDSATAARYVSALSKAGLAVRIEPMAPPATDLHLAPTVAFEPEPEAQSEVDRCPKCGVAAVRDGVCGACGIVVSKYLARVAADAGPSHTTGAGPQTDSDAGPPGSPYSLPTWDSAPETRPHGQEAIPGPHALSAGQGWGWISRGFWHFKTNPWTWILVTVGYALLIMAVSLIPLLGGILASLIAPILTGGLMVGAHDQARGKPLGFQHLFAGFSNHTGQLVAAGAIYLGGMVLAAIPALLLVGGPMVRGMGSMDPTGFGEDPQLMAGAMADAFASQSFLLAILVAALLMLPVAMAYWFAPALIAIDGLGAWSAMKLSFRGCLRNILPLLVYGVLGLVLIIVGSLPMLLGLLVVMPTLIASMYVSYRSIFHRNRGGSFILPP